MKAVIVNMNQKSQIKPHNLCKFQQVCTTVQISVARLEDPLSEAPSRCWNEALSSRNQTSAFFCLGASGIQGEQYCEMGQIIFINKMLSLLINLCFAYACFHERATITVKLSGVLNVFFRIHPSLGPQCPKCAEMLLRIACQGNKGG